MGLHHDSSEHTRRIIELGAFIESTRKRHHRVRQLHRRDIRLHPEHGFRHDQEQCRLEPGSEDERRMLEDILTLPESLRRLLRKEIKVDRHRKEDMRLCKYAGTMAVEQHEA